MQRPFAPLIGTPSGAFFSDMGQRVRPGIAEGLGIRCAADANGIEHDQENAVH